MLDRFIIYQSIIECLTILHRNVVSDLSSSIIQNLKNLIFAENEWNHLIATRNVLAVLYEACKLLSGKNYQTLSISYIITIGLRHLLKQQSTSAQSDIENTIKKYLFDTFLHYFDHKLSIDQKHAMLVSLFRILKQL